MSFLKFDMRHWGLPVKGPRRDGPKDQRKYHVMLGESMTHVKEVLTLTTTYTVSTQ